MRIRTQYLDKVHLPDSPRSEYFTAIPRWLRHNEYLRYGHIELENILVYFILHDTADIA